MGLLAAAGVVSLACVSVSAQGPVPTPPPFGEHTFDPLDYRVEVTNKLMCQACYAAVKELNKRVPMLHNFKKKLTRELVLYEAMNAFCVDGNFFEYTGFPPAYTRACQAFLDRFNDDSDVEAAILQGGSIADQCARACAPACTGVDEGERHTTYAITGVRPDPPVYDPAADDGLLDDARLFSDGHAEWAEEDGDGQDDDMADEPILPPSF